MAIFAALSLAGAAAARPLRLVALGDSLTAGYGLPPGQAFPDVLGRALKAKGWDVEMVNAGVSGDTAADGLARFDWSVPEGADAIIVELGANDMLRGGDPAATEVTLAHILAKAKDAQMATLLAGMVAAPNYGEDYKRRFDAIYPELAQRFGVTLYPFFLEGVAGERNLQLGDGLHPNRDGVERIVEGILPSVETTLNEVKR
ncbi:MAG: arylesterase [Bradyrhizobium sp.]|nr:MAG: arylesterase [Bradyrhizobium sp.]